MVLVGEVAATLYALEHELELEHLSEESLSILLEIKKEYNTNTWKLRIISDESYSPMHIVN